MSNEQLKPWRLHALKYGPGNCPGCQTCSDCDGVRIEAVSLINKLHAALRDAIRSPKGVVPDSACDLLGPIPEDKTDD